MRKFIYGALAGLIIGTAVYIHANDNVRQGSGVVRQAFVTRWQTNKVGGEAGSGTTATTNVVSTVSSIIGRVIFNCPIATDSIQIFNSTSGSGATAANRVFVSLGNSPTTANSPTLSNSPTLNGSSPLNSDLNPGLSCSSGIVVITTRASITTGATADILWDTAITDNE